MTEKQKNDICEFCYFSVASFLLKKQPRSNFANRRTCQSTSAPWYGKKDDKGKSEKELQNTVFRQNDIVRGNDQTLAV
jgi:hypothetical protein